MTSAAPTQAQSTALTTGEAYHGPVTMPKLQLSQGTVQVDEHGTKAASATGTPLFLARINDPKAAG